MVIFVLKVKGKDDILEITKDFSVFDEKEFLLNDGLTFKVTKVDYITDNEPYYEIELEKLSQAFIIKRNEKEK